MILERGDERERNPNVREKRRSVASRMPQARVPTEIEPAWSAGKPSTRRAMPAGAVAAFVEVLACLASRFSSEAHSAGSAQ